MKQTPDTYTRVSRATYILASVCMVFLPWFKYTVDRTSVTRSFYNLFRESVDTGVFGNLNNTLFYAFGALLFVAALVGIVLSLLGKSSGSLLYFGTALLSFALLVIPTAKGFAAEGESAFSVLRICP